MDMLVRSKIIVCTYTAKKDGEPIATPGYKSGRQMCIRTFV